MTTQAKHAAGNWILLLLVISSSLVSSKVIHPENSVNDELDCQDICEQGLQSDQCLCDDAASTDVDKRQDRTMHIFRWGKRNDGTSTRPASHIFRWGKRNAIDVRTPSKIFRWGKRDQLDDAASSSLIPEDVKDSPMEDMSPYLDKRKMKVFRWGKRDGDDMKRYQKIFRWGKRGSPSSIFRWGKREEPTRTIFRWGKRTPSSAKLFRWGKRDSDDELQKITQRLLDNYMYPDQYENGDEAMA